jgi:hypothetical protein
MIWEVSADLKSTSAAADNQGSTAFHHQYCRAQFLYNICSTATSTLS